MCVCVCVYVCVCVCICLLTKNYLQNFKKDNNTSNNNILHLQQML